MRELPAVKSLEEAVQTVIRRNKKDGYNPTYFTQAVVNTDDVIRTCSKLIKSQSSYSALVDAFWDHPDLLTLEDFVVVHGGSWGFSEDVIEEAQNRVRAFDELVKHRRYSHDANGTGSTSNDAKI